MLIGVTWEVVRSPAGAVFPRGEHRLSAADLERDVPDPRAMHAEHLAGPHRQNQSTPYGRPRPVYQDTPYNASQASEITSESKKSIDFESWLAPQTMHAGYLAGLQQRRRRRGCRGAGALNKGGGLQRCSLVSRRRCGVGACGMPRPWNGPQPHGAVVRAGAERAAVRRPANPATSAAVRCHMSRCKNLSSLTNRWLRSLAVRELVSTHHGTAAVSRSHRQSAAL